MHSTTDQIDVIRKRLKRNGWSIGEFHVLRQPEGAQWTVSGFQGDQRIAVEAETQIEAWMLAENEARKLGSGQN